jgi:hypothetical protein
MTVDECLARLEHPTSARIGKSPEGLGYTSPFAPIWINEMVHRQETGSINVIVGGTP